MSKSEFDPERESDRVKMVRLICESAIALAAVVGVFVVVILVLTGHLHLIR